MRLSPFTLTTLIRGEWPYGRLRDLRRSQWWPRERLEALQLKKLDRVLKASASNRAYRSMLSDAGIEAAAPSILAGLERFPIIEKSDLAAFGKIAGASGSGPWPAVTTRRSSGTSGIPLAVHADAGPSAATHAARMRAFEWFGIDRGEREARLWGRPAASTWKTHMKNRLLNRSIWSNDDLTEENIGATLDEMSACQPALVYGYSSMINELTRRIEALDRQDAVSSVRLVVCTAEGVSPPELERIGRVFGCPAVAEYGCSEVDIMAFTCPEGRMHVQAENVILEVVETDCDGGGEALVTDLNNVLTPIIRYRLGDVIRLSAEPCPCGRGLPVLEAVQGRTQNRYLALPDGGREHVVMFSYVIEDALAEGHPIEGFRIVQESIDRVLLEIVANDPGTDREGLRSLLQERIGGRLPSPLELRIEYRDMIPRSSSGKVENFVPLDRNAGPRG